MFRQRRRLGHWINRLRRKRIAGDDFNVVETPVDPNEEKGCPKVNIGGNVDTTGSRTNRAMDPTSEQRECILCSETECVDICSCSANICNACMEQWFKTKPTCPTCPACNQCLDPVDLVQTLGMSELPGEEKIKIVQKPSHAEACEDTLTNDWITTQEDTKRCPQCHVWIIRDGGEGVRIACARCQHEFCWICLVPMSQCVTWHSESEDGTSDIGLERWSARIRMDSFDS